MTFPADRGFVVAFSGGADSTFLLHRAHEFARTHGVELVAVHVHHGLRPSADIDAAHCDNVCAQLGVPFETARVDVVERNSVMQQARAQRYAALAGVAHRYGLRDIITGHHADDQRENAQIAAERGDAGFQIETVVEFPYLDITIHRPFLNVTRSEIEADLRAAGLAWVEDPANTNTKYARAEVRQNPRSTTVSPAVICSVERLNRTTVFASISEEADVIARSLTKASHGAILGVGHLGSISELKRGKSGPYSVTGGVIWADDHAIYLTRTLGQGSNGFSQVASPLKIRTGSFPWFGYQVTIADSQFDGSKRLTAHEIRGCEPGTRLRNGANRKASERLRQMGVPTSARWRYPMLIHDDGAAIWVDAQPEGDGLWIKIE